MAPGHGDEMSGRLRSLARSELALEGTARTGGHRVRAAAHKTGTCAIFRDMRDIS